MENDTFDVENPRIISREQSEQLEGSVMTKNEDGKEQLIPVAHPSSDAGRVSIATSMSSTPGKKRPPKSSVLSTSLAYHTKKEPGKESSKLSVLSNSSALLPPNLIDILDDTRPTPFSRNDYRVFLKSRLIEENMDFWINVRAFLEVYKFGMKIERVDKGADVVLKYQNETDDRVVSKAIFNVFACDGADREINIPDSIRTKMAENIKNPSETREERLTVFDEAADEVFKLLELNSFDAFMSIAAGMNLSTTSARIRFLYAYAFLFVVLSFASVLIYFEFLGLVPSRWFRIIPGLMFFLFLDYYMSAKFRICDVCTHFEVTQAQTGLSVNEAKKRGLQKLVEDPYANYTLKTKTSRLSMYKKIGTLIFLGVLLSIPPYNNYA